jgi:outer membrane protein, heavy metal efflux system
LVDLQQSAPLDRLDNQQNIVARQAIVIEAQLRWQQASIDLSLFLRDALGQPIIPTQAQLPVFPTPVAPVPSRLNGVIEDALGRRPEVRRLRLQRETLEVELRWAENQTLPQLNAFVAGARDLGFAKPTTGPGRLDRESLEVGVELALPLQFRDARGRAETLRAQVRQLQGQERFAADAIRAEVQATFASVERGYALWSQAQTRTGLAAEVARGERELFALGRSDVLRITLREQAAFDAQVIEVGAKQEYFRARADHQAAAGIDELPTVEPAPAAPQETSQWNG